MNVPDVEHQRPLPHSAADFKEGAAGASRAQGPRWTRPLVLAVWAATLAVAMHAWVAYTNGRGSAALQESWRDALASLEMNEVTATLGLRLPWRPGSSRIPGSARPWQDSSKCASGVKTPLLGRRQQTIAEQGGSCWRWCRELGSVPLDSNFTTVQYRAESREPEGPRLATAWTRGIEAFGDPRLGAWADLWSPPGSADSRPA